MAEQLKPGDYIGLYIDNVLIYTGVLKDQGVMESGRKVYQVLLVKNIFQRNFPEIHFDSDIRPATWEQVQAEIKRLKIKLQKNLEQLEDNVEQLISEKELHNIIGWVLPADELYNDAHDRIQSGGTGAGYSGIHYEIMNELRRYGLAANSREEALRLLKQLLTEYEKTEFGSSASQSDEDYLSKFDDI